MSGTVLVLWPSWVRQLVIYGPNKLYRNRNTGWHEEYKRVVLLAGERVDLDSAVKQQRHHGHMTCTTFFWQSNVLFQLAPPVLKCAIDLLACSPVPTSGLPSK